MPSFTWRNDILTRLSQARFAKRVSPRVQRATLRLAMASDYAPAPSDSMRDDVFRSLVRYLGCSDREAQRIAAEHSTAMYRAGLMWYYLRGADQPQITAFIRDAVRVVHAEYVHDLPPGPIIVFSAHGGLPVAGALELARALGERTRLNTLFGRTRLSTFLAAPEDNPSTAGYPELLERSGLGINTMLVNSRATLLALRALKAGEALTMQPDVYDNRNASAILVPFLNGLTYAMTGTAFLTLRSQATLIPAFARVLPGGRVVVTYEPPIQYEATGDDTRDLYDLTAAIHRSIEVRVGEAPDQWIYWQTLQNRMAPGVILPGDRGDDAAWAQAFAATTEWAARVAPPLASTIRELPGLCEHNSSV